MSDDLGDISHLFEEPVADLDWLEVDEEMYRLYETLPKQNLDAIPDLVDAWKHREERPSFSLAQVNGDPAFRNTPFWSERSLPAVLNTQEQEELILSVYRNYLQSGMYPKTASEQLAKNFDSRDLHRAHPRLKAVYAQEAGLLGHLYVDAALFPQCASGKGRERVASRSHAQYMKAKTACQDCVYNAEGRCAVMQKELVFDVRDLITEGSWAEYTSQFAGIDFGKVSSLPVRERFLRAMTLRPDEHHREGFKPVVVNPAKGVRLSDAVQSVREAEVTREVVGDLALERKRDLIARKMLAGDHSTDLVGLLQSDPTLHDMRRHAHVMGRLYVDLSFFRTASEAFDFLEERGLKDQIPFIVGSPRDGGYTGQALDWKSASVLDHICGRYSLATRGKKSATKTAHLARFRSRLERVSADKVRQIAQEVYSRILPVKVAAYQNLGMVVYNPAEGITLKKASAELAAARNEILVLEKSAAPDRIRVANAFLVGEYQDEVLLQRMKDPRLADLRSEQYLHGQLYVNASLYEHEGQYQDLIKRLSKQHLPVVTDPDVFLVTREAHERLGEQMALVKAVDPVAQPLVYRATVKKVLTSLEGKTAAEVRRFAKRLYQKQAATRSYQGRRYTDAPEVGTLSTAQMQEGLARLASSRPQAEARGIAAWFTKEQHPALQRILSARLKDKAVMQRAVRQASTDDANLSGVEQKVLAAVLRVHSQPLSESTLILPSAAMFRHPVGAFLRDQMLKGVSGTRLSDALRNRFAASELIAAAPLILAMREEEGLFGQVYATADAYPTCEETYRKTKHVPQIVRTASCRACRDCDPLSCQLSRKGFTDQPQYEGILHDVLADRVASGALTMHKAEDLLTRLADHAPRTRVRVAALTRSESHEKRRYQGPAVRAHVMTQTRRVVQKDRDAILAYAQALVDEGWHGKDLVNQVKMAAAPEVLQDVRAELLTILRQQKRPELPEHTLAALQAPSGLEQMASFGLDPMSGSGLTIGFNAEAEHEELDIDMGASFTLDL